MDLSNDDEPVTFVCNFRKYIRTIIKDCLNIPSHKLILDNIDVKEFKKRLRKAYNESDKFSKKLIIKKYKLKSNDE